MFPVGGSGIGRYADKAVNLGGYLIPAGTEVAVCLHTMHMVPWNFPEPERFNPDRWLATVEEGACMFPCAWTVATSTFEYMLWRKCHIAAQFRSYIALPSACLTGKWIRRSKCMSVLPKQHLAMPLRAVSCCLWCRERCTGVYHRRGSRMGGADRCSIRGSIGCR